MKRAPLYLLRPLLFAPFALASLSGCGSDETTPPKPAGPTYPSAPVELVTDDLGVTHVYAKTDADAFYGAGYSMARDRLFHMELNRRKALGTQAEVLGDKMLKGDIGARAFNFKKLGEDNYQQLLTDDKEQAGLIEAWCAGVNKRIEEVKSGAAPRPYGLGPGELDFVPEPWTPAHALAIGKVLSFGLSNTFNHELLATALLRLVPQSVQKYPIVLSGIDSYIMPSFGGTPQMPKKATGPFFTGQTSPAPKDVPAFRYADPVFPTFASNNWAVDGAHSDNGKPLLASDPHQGLTSPTRLWPLHMSSVEGGGTLDVMGFAFVGTPSVELGHNGHIAWSATTNFGDSMDMWDVQLGGTFENVTVGGETHKVVKRTEVIKVGAVGGGEPTEASVDIYDVPSFNGVIIPDEVLPVPRSVLVDGYILFKWVGFEPTHEISTYLGFDRAKNLDEFEAAVDKLEIGVQNFVAADATGIDYHVHANLPDRGDPASHPMPWRILPAADKESMWTRGFLPPSKLPSVRNPARGFIATANNDPWGFTSDGSVENDPFYYGTFYAHGFRAKRIEQVLDGVMKQRKVTRKDMEDLQGDSYSLTAEAMLPLLDAAMKAAETDPALSAYKGRADLQQLVTRLLAWDKRFDRKQAEPVIFFALEWFATKRIFEPLVGGLLFEPISQQSPGFLVGGLLNVLGDRFTGASQLLPDGKDALLLASLDDTAKWLVKRFGAIDAQYTMADVHAAEFPSDFGGKLTVPRVPVNGSLDTVNVAGAPFFANGQPLDQFATTEMALFRFVFGFGDDGTPEATVDFARGSREDPNDPYFNNQEQLWADAGHTVMPFRKADVDAHSKERVTLGVK